MFNSWILALGAAGYLGVVATLLGIVTMESVDRSESWQAVVFGLAAVGSIIALQRHGSMNFPDVVLTTSKVSILLWSLMIPAGYFGGFRLIRNLFRALYGGSGPVEGEAQAGPLLARVSLAFVVVSLIGLVGAKVAAKARDDHREQR